ncbi:MAG: ECF-type sigma factor [Phycisphaerae bacterium]|nr:ECF-type sigma factor [Phycisphaerae bacterium]
MNQPSMSPRDPADSQPPRGHHAQQSHATSGARDKDIPPTPTSTPENPAAGSPAKRQIADLVPIVYDDLRRYAQAYLRRQPAGFTLGPTELVNEACIQLIERAKVDWQSPEHFRAIAVRKIWQVILDHHRRRGAQKRGGHAARTPVDPDEIEIRWHDRVVDVLDVGDALDGLAAESQRLHDVVMLHWFGGMKYAEVAKVLAVSSSTVEKDFRYALAWLNRRLEDVKTTDGRTEDDRTGDGASGA